MVLLHFQETFITLCNSRKRTSINHTVVTDLLISQLPDITPMGGNAAAMMINMYPT